MAAGNNSFNDFILSLHEERRSPMKKLVETVEKNLIGEYEKSVQSNMVHFTVPLSKYPAGYHCTPGKPLPFISIASQKNFIALYHMGVYADVDTLNWFTGKYPEYSKYKLDMGKSCIRFKRMNDIPYDLIAQLIKRITINDWINLYEKALKK